MMPPPTEFPPRPTSLQGAQNLLEATRRLRQMAAATLEEAEKLDKHMSAALTKVTEWAREWGIDA